MADRSLPCDPPFIASLSSCSSLEHHNSADRQKFQSYASHPLHETHYPQESTLRTLNPVSRQSRTRPPASFSQEFSMKPTNPSQTNLIQFHFTSTHLPLPVPGGRAPAQNAPKQTESRLNKLNPVSPTLRGRPIFLETGHRCQISQFLCCEALGKGRWGGLSSCSPLEHPNSADRQKYQSYASNSSHRTHSPQESTLRTLNPVSFHLHPPPLPGSGQPLAGQKCPKTHRIQVKQT